MMNEKVFALPNIAPHIDVEFVPDTLEQPEVVVRGCCDALLKTLSPLMKDDYDFTICFSSDEEVKMLNGQFRGKNKPTNVLSFPVWEKNPDTNIMYLGDIIVAKETVEREAKEQNVTVQAHVQHLVVHGLLHLLGFDHIIDKEADVMEDIEIRILSTLGVANPYI